MRIMAFPAYGIIDAVVVFAGKNIRPQMAVKADFLAFAQHQLFIFRSMRIMALSAEPCYYRAMNEGEFIGKIIVALVAQSRHWLPEPVASRPDVTFRAFLVFIWGVVIYSWPYPVTNRCGRCKLGSIYV